VKSFSKSFFFGDDEVMKISLLFLIFILFSCASSFRTPEARMLSPEAQGKPGLGSLELRLASFQRRRANFKDNSTKKPFVPAASLYGVTGNLELGAIFRKLDIYVNPNLFSNAASVIGVKYQLIGKTRNESDRGNFSTSLAAGYGGYSGGYNKEAFFQSSEKTPDHIKKLNYKMDHFEAGVISGYRWTKNLLHYVNYFYVHEDVSGEVQTVDKVLNFKRFNTHNKGSLASTGLMFYFSERGYLKADYTHMLSAMKAGRSQSSNTGSAAIGYSW
jgi:hypothetical protein